MSVQIKYWMFLKSDNYSLHKNKPTFKLLQKNTMKKYQQLEMFILFYYPTNFIKLIRINKFFGRSIFHFYSKFFKG